jgi:hypothetical protein
MGELARRARTLLRGLVAALLPSPERERWTRGALDPAPYSAALGAVQLVAGIGLFFTSWLSFMRGGTAAGSQILLENWFPGLLNTHFMGVGLLNGIAWFLHPLAWIFGGMALMGLARCAAFGAVGVSLAEPAVWALLRARQGLDRWRARRRRARALGPPRPDRLSRPGPGELLLLTGRERPEWNRRVAIEVQGRHYRLVRLEEREEGDRITLAYHLREKDPSEVFRGVVHYRGPGESPGPSQAG